MIRFLPVIIFILNSCTEQSEISKTSSTVNSNNASKKENSTPPVNKIDTSNGSNKLNDYSVKSLQLDDGWGYEIYKGSKLLISQKNIPAVQGNQFFLSEKDAVTVGKLVINKLINNEFPPSITTEELINLGIVFQR